MTTRTLSENFEGFSQILKEQSGKKEVLGCVCTPNSNNLKIWKPPYQKINLRVRVVNKYADTRFLNLAKTKRFVKPFLPVHMGPMSDLLSKTYNGRISRDTGP